jgi:hypothetical protein
LPDREVLLDRGHYLSFLLHGNALEDWRLVFLSVIAELAPSQYLSWDAVLQKTGRSQLRAIDPEQLVPDL